MDLAKIVAKIGSMTNKKPEYRASRICWEVMGSQAAFEGLHENAQILMRAGAQVKMEYADGAVRESFKFASDEERKERKEKLARLSRAKANPSYLQEALRVRGNGFFDAVYLFGRPIGEMNAADFNAAAAKAKAEIAGKTSAIAYYEWAEAKCAKSGKIFRDSVSMAEAQKMYNKYHQG